ncbi:MAG: hypothetical protein PVH37_29020 [Desulfobacterales bacterium]|jgi:hypothetical protein
MPRFEIKNFGENHWQKVSEKFFLIKLTDNYEMITPILIEMLYGEEIVGYDCVYRIKNT